MGWIWPERLGVSCCRTGLSKARARIGRQRQPDGAERKLKLARRGGNRQEHTTLTRLSKTAMFSVLNAAFCEELIDPNTNAATFMDARAAKAAARIRASQQTPG